MADKRSLALLGLVFAVMTAGVVLASLLVVKAHVEGRIDIESHALQPGPTDGFLPQLDSGNQHRPQTR